MGETEKMYVRELVFRLLSFKNLSCQSQLMSEDLLDTGWAKNEASIIFNFLIVSLFTRNHLCFKEGDEFTQWARIIGSHIVYSL